MISVLFHTFFFTFGKVTDSQSFKYKEYSVSGAKLFLEEYTYWLLKMLVMLNKSTKG